MPKLISPLMTNGCSHHNHVGESTFSLRASRVALYFNFIHQSVITTATPPTGKGVTFYCPLNAGEVKGV